MGNVMGICMGAPEEVVPKTLWQDRQIRWDVAKSLLTTRPGEEIVEVFENIEDTKGDNMIGILMLTNLRVIWQQAGNPKCNISIGLGNINYLHYNMVDSKTYGRLRVPYIMTQSKGSRFEFTFAAQTSELNLRLFGIITKHHRAYRATRIYRDLILRDEHIIKDQHLSLLPNENLLHVVEGCDNLTTDDAFVGRMFITSFRIVWFALETPNVNVSVPFIQIGSVTSRKSSRHGNALVIDTLETSGSYTLGFRVSEPNAPLILFQLQKCLTECHKHPYLGPTDANVRVENDRLVVVAPPSAEEEAEETQRHADTMSRPENVMAMREQRMAAGVDADANRIAHLSHQMALAAAAGEAANRNGEEEGQSGRQPSVSFADSGALSRDLNEAPMSAEMIDRRGQMGPISPQSRKYAESMRCVVCWSNKIDAAFDPCGHMSTCMTCAEKLLEGCPICRKEINKVLRIFMVGQ
eukprot:GDKK01072208.1.p1 GENE.GDKK01072208.1~~GDKK01072208.1.p1  ORF type:complete len:466 (-),score=69.51 GDKK01072208.1:550-1947(-)